MCHLGDAAVGYDIEGAPAEVKPLNPTSTIPPQPACWTSGSYTSEIWRKAFQKDYLGKNGTFNSMSLIGTFLGCCRIYGIVLRTLMEIVDTTGAIQFCKF